MAYTKNPHMPKVRAKAVNLVVEKEWSIRKVARYIGVQPSTVSRWVKRAGGIRIYTLPTRSSRPKKNPRSIAKNIEKRIVEIRLKRNRCAQIVHAQLIREEYQVSLSTVKRVLDRWGLVKKKSPWKKYHQSGERPIPEKAGILVQTDSIHLMKPLNNRVYILTLIDCFSRWAYAQASEKLNTHTALRFFWEARTHAPFSFSCIQSDHGPEFSKFFTVFVESLGIRHRHSRVRKPNDNAHIERFNRTIQDEMKSEISLYRSNTQRLNDAIHNYMTYYNSQRLHLGLECSTPLEVLRRS